MLGGDLTLLEAKRGKKQTTSLPSPKETEDNKVATRASHLQRRLSSLGFDTKDDGQFGSQTDASVKQFQHHAGLKEDGQVGPKTTQALKTAPAPEDMEDSPGEDGAAGAAAPAANGATPPKAGAAKPADAARPAMKKGKAKEIGGKDVLSKGIAVGEENGDPNVEDLQAHLEELGYPNITLDGKFGPETERSVKAFQKKMGLKSDGLVGPKTKRTMAGLHSNLYEAIERRERADARDFPAALARERVLRRRVAHGIEEADSKGDKPGVAGGGSMKRCPSCGWKMKAGTTKCGKCKADLRKKGDAKTKAKDE